MKKVFLDSFVKKDDFNAEYNDGTSKKALENLETADQNLIYDLYYASHSFLSVYPILENWIDGADICSSVERFQKEFLRIYQKEEL